MKDALMSDEYQAWLVVMDEFFALGVTLAVFNSRGRGMVAALDTWAKHRAALLTLNTSIVGSDLKAMADWQNTGKDGRVL